MNNAELARVFSTIAELLELKGESPFKIRAYQRAAKALENYPVEAELLLQEKRLHQVPGVGEAIAKKITELLTTGQLKYYEELRAEFPEGIVTLMEVPGIGPKTALRLAQEGITTLEALEQALLSGQVAALPRMGEKSAENLLRHLQSLRRKEQRTPIGQALPVVEEILASLSSTQSLHRLTPAGSLRRFRETIGDIDLMGTAENPPEAIHAFTHLPQVREVLAAGTTKASVVVAGGFQVDLRLVEEDAFGSLLQYFTGSKEHNILLRERGVKQWLKLSEYGITTLATGELEKFREEEAYYRRLGLQYIPPELREGRDEIERAEANALPKLLELPDLKGDLHVHTEWSDGHDSLEDIARAARARGYQYVAITDHSAGRGIARGLTWERFLEQRAEIERVNQKVDGVRVLWGAEVDIRADGTLDLPDEQLAELEVAVAAMHSSLDQREERMTARVLKALENPHVDILAHPSCRLLGERPPAEMDMEAVFRAALQRGKTLEINAMPSRLDLKDSHIHRARELGVKLTISTDAHSAAQLDFIRFGVGIARRGWCQANDILNTRPLEEMLAFLQRHS